MKGPAVVGPDRPAFGWISVVGVALVAVFAALIAAQPSWLARLQTIGFDLYASLKPRIVAATPVTVVAIDEKSLARLGQWPWPRTVLAQLVREIERYDPVAIGVDLLMPEPDRLSPERLLTEARSRDPVLANRLEALPSNDTVLANAIAGGRVVLGVAGTPDPTSVQPLGPPFVIRDAGGTANARIAVDVPTFCCALRNVDALDEAASGHGALSAGSSDAVIRRLPMVVRIADRLVPSLSIEMLRVALGVPDVQLYVEGSVVRSVGVGDVVVPTEADGQLRIHYSARDHRRFVSAIDVLERTIDPVSLQRKLVLIGTSGLAIVDYQSTPLGMRMPGTEIHAQLLENLVEQSWLTRPSWARALEVATFAVLGLLLAVLMPRSTPGGATALAAACIALPLGAGFAAFAGQRWVFDAVTPTAALVVVFGLLLLCMLAQARRHRNALERALALQREREAYVAGEMEAAKRIQLGFLPRNDALDTDRRIEIAATMAPAREVGGDLYDYFMLDANRLFFLVGDVAGKGLSASIFMAVSKALYKSAALGSGHASVGALMQKANVEVSRDNAEMFFVTAFAAVLDLQSGELAYCNAGHENPYVLREDAPIDRLEDGDGPALCTVEGFAYAAGERRLREGDLLCIVTDGVVDARNARGERYGHPRLQAVMESAASDRGTAHDCVEAIRADVARFSGDVDAVDDLTVLALRWRGPGSAA